MATARILLVEDEASLAGLMERYLTRSGYSVETFGRGEAAWERFSNGEASFDLAVVDLTLPDVHGEELLRRILAESPAMPALICSGTPDSGAFAGHSRVSFLQKPFLPSRLAECVQAALAGKRGVEC